MVANRKRKRSSSDNLESSHPFSPAPPPFAPSLHALYQSYRAPLPRNFTHGISPAYLNLVIMAGQRLRARDFVSAANALPALFKRYRRKGHQRWFFTREIAVTGAEVLRRHGTSHADLLDEFLAQMARDGHLSMRGGPQGYPERVREAVLLERTMELLAQGKMKAAFDVLQQHSQENDFRESALIHGYLGVIALAASGAEREPGGMLRIAAKSLNLASEIEPTAYFYVYYAAAAAMAAGRKDEALQMLRTYVDERHRTDPVALYGMLSCLARQEKKDSLHIRQERVDIARRLIAIDPLSSVAINVLVEANAWHWIVQPLVDTMELAEALGGKIEHGDVCDSASWIALGKTLWGCHAEQRVFWEYSQRNNWWPSHFFRVSKLNADIAISPQLASAKGAVAKMLQYPERSAYAQAVETSGVVDLFKFKTD